MAHSLESLITILEEILDPQQTQWILDHNKPQLQTLLEKVVSLHQILEISPLSDIESLESQIRDAAHKAEDIVEAHMLDQMRSSPGAVSFTFSTPDLQQVISQVVKLTERYKMLIATSRSIVVGLDEDLRELKERLTGMPSKLQIVPIVGMGGIGKTTLARQLYQDQLIVEHFKYLAWATISQDHNMRSVLFGLLRCVIGKDVDQYTEKADNELKDILYKRLYSGRYMIVLDDIWKTNFLDQIRKYFPDTKNGSRIVITTRQAVVAKQVGSEKEQHQMHLLNVSESWDLLRQEVFFGEEGCPAALEEIGRNIASNCGGLPLAIHVVGGLLSKTKRIKDLWDKVANDVREAMSKSDKQFFNIFSLSYNHLPSHLRPCFLYMGAFPEDYEIKTSRLIGLWVAEGFLESTENKSLEVEAEDCLKALVDRNLVSVRAVKSNGRPKRYGMHDLMRDLCLRKAEELGFVHVGSKEAGVIEKESMYRLRRVSIHPSYGVGDISPTAELMSLARSFLCIDHASHDILTSVFCGGRLLRVLDVFKIDIEQFQTEILRIVNLRYLAFSFSPKEVPSDIARLCNLQTLVICSSGGYITLPCEILQMAELRQVIVYNAEIKIESSDWSGVIQESKLQRISTINDPREDFLHRIPNIRNLGIRIRRSSILHLHHLHKLEILKLFGDDLVSPSTLTLPLSLRKLSLTGCKIVGDFMRYLCEKLPDLQVLKLQECEFDSGSNQQEWDATELDFSKLQFLLLERLQLVHWQADETNFPRLRHLVIRGCSALEGIPSEIGDIPTLQTIRLDSCSQPLVASATSIIKEQQQNGNNGLQLRM